jgi:hypothetical protein
MIAVNVGFSVVLRKILIKPFVLHEMTIYATQMVLWITKYTQPLLHDVVAAVKPHN